MEKITVDGEEIIVVKLRRDHEGGAEILTLVPAGNGEYFADRQFIGEGVKHDAEGKRLPLARQHRQRGQNQARLQYASLKNDRNELRRRIASARAEHEITE